MASSGDRLRFPELRIVMLGWRGTGKSSSGNTILGREEFDLRTFSQCVRRQGEVAGRQVTVVDTPGWTRSLPVEKTPELVKQEMVHSMSLCPPGPHAFLLVIQGDEIVSEEGRKSVEQHMQLFNERVWSHTILLITKGDCRDDSSNEPPNDSEAMALLWLIEKCGERYHIFNNKDRGDVHQVPELFEKIEMMSTRNPGEHYEMERERLQMMELWRERHEERAKKRELLVEKKRKDDQTFISHTLNLSELRVVLLGNTGAGKSSSGNTILGREEFDLRTAAQCVRRQGEVAGRQVTVVDTPGWTRSLPVEDSTELLRHFTDCLALCPPGPHTCLLVIPANMSFKDEEANGVEDHLELLQVNVWSHILVLFTNGDCLGETSIEQHIQREGKALQWLVGKCGNRYHVFNNQTRDVTQVTDLLEKLEEMIAVNSGDHFYLGGVSEAESMLTAGVRTTDLPLRGEEDGSSDRLSEMDSAYGTSASQITRPSTKQTTRDTLSPIFDKNEASDTSNLESAPSTTAEELDPAIMTPEISQEVLYRLQCPAAGLFQCSSTGLMFLMKGKGDVLYSTVPWDAAQHSTGLTPAGPLFSMDCPQNTVCELHLPHCELPDGGGLDALSVLHVSGDSVMVLPPLRVTDTYFVVKVPNLCFLGLLKRRKKPQMIKGQVLLFKNCMDCLIQCAAVILLPRNVPIEKVSEKQRGFKEVQRTDCTFVQEEYYSLMCSLMDQPEEENSPKYHIYPTKTIQFDEDYGANYNPAFSLSLTERFEIVRLRLVKREGDGGEVWKGALSLQDSATMYRPPAAVAPLTGPAECQLLSARTEFIRRVSGPVLDCLLLRLEEKTPPDFLFILNSWEAETVRQIAVVQTKAQKILDMVVNKGNTASSVLISSLSAMDPYLYRTLGFS